jgi:glycosyltransferase involved in cell wall biosynthesis
MSRTDVTDAPAPAAIAGLARKAVLVAGPEDWEPTRSRVLLDVLKELAREVVVVGPPANRLEPAGGGAVEFNFGGRWRNPVRETTEAFNLARTLEAEGADLVHVVGVKPAVLACLAFRLSPPRHTVLHLPDLGPLAPDGGLGRPYRALALRLLASQLRKPTAFLLVEGEADLNDLRAEGITPGARFALLGGSGIDPDTYPLMPPSQSEMPVAAFVGPVAEASGLRTLLRAFERVWARGVRLQLDLFGEVGTQGEGGISFEEWTRWSRHPGVRCSGAPADVREVWRRAEICVRPAESRQGLPRVLVEAAACGRALLVTDVSGGSSFVRHGLEGFVVPAGDAAALAEALERLARDPSMRQRMGAAARLRMLQGHTEAHVTETLRGAYLSLIGAGRR